MAETIKASAGQQVEQAGFKHPTCDCVCHRVGLFGLLCCPCTRKALDEFVNGKFTKPVAPSPVSVPPDMGELEQEIILRIIERDESVTKKFVTWECFVQNNISPLIREYAASVRQQTERFKKDFVAVCKQQGV